MTTSPEQPLGRPAWTGAITFGLVAVPMKLYTATETHSGPAGHQDHATDLGRIRYRKYCEAENRELRQDEIARGAERGGGMVVLTDEDMEQLPLPTRHVIDVHAFVPEIAINSLAWNAPYCVGLGDKAPAKPYQLLPAFRVIQGLWSNDMPDDLRLHLSGRPQAVSLGLGVSAGRGASGCDFRSTRTTACCEPSRVSR